MSDTKRLICFTKPAVATNDALSSTRQSQFSGTPSLVLWYNDEVKVTVLVLLRSPLKNSDLPLLAKFSYRVVIASHLAVGKALRATGNRRSKALRATSNRRSKVLRATSNRRSKSSFRGALKDLFNLLTILKIGETFNVTQTTHTS